MKNRIIIPAISLIIVFLAGFVPQYTKARRLENELREMRQNCAGAELRDLAGLAYFQATEKNYGLARDTAMQFFNRAREAANQATDANSRKALEDLMTLHDTVMAQLSKADASTVGDLHVLFMRSRQSTAWRTVGPK